MTLLLMLMFVEMLIKLYKYTVTMGFRSVLFHDHKLFKCT